MLAARRALFLPLAAVRAMSTPAARVRAMEIALAMTEADLREHVPDAPPPCRGFQRAGGADDENADGPSPQLVAAESRRRRVAATARWRIAATTYRGDAVSLRRHRCDAIDDRIAATPHQRVRGIKSPARRYSGSYAGRHVEKLYATGGFAGSLERAAAALFGGGRTHALVASGFYVLHDFGGAAPPGLAPGSCETDGPLGALAVVRALAARGVRASLYCEAHNGPVLAAGYDAMLRYYDAKRPEVAKRLREFSRCLPAGPPLGPDPRACAEDVGRALAAAWAGAPGAVDALVAIERLSAP